MAHIPRRIDRIMAEAFCKGKTLREHNTKVIVKQGVVTMYLFDTPIAKRELGTPDILLSYGGWPTPTTTARLNGILRYLDNDCLFFSLSGATFIKNERTGSRWPLADKEWVTMHGVNWTPQG